MDVDPVELAHWKVVAAKPFDEAPRWEYLKWLKVQSDKSHEERAKFTELQLDSGFCQPWDFLALQAANFRSPYFSTWGPVWPLPELSAALPWKHRAGVEVTRWAGGFPSAALVHDLLHCCVELERRLLSAPMTSLELEPFVFRVVSESELWWLEHEARMHRRISRQGGEYPLEPGSIGRIAAARLSPRQQLLDWTREHEDFLLAVLNRPWFQRLRHFSLDAEERLLCAMLRGLDLNGLNSLALTVRRASIGGETLDPASDLLKELGALPVLLRLQRLSIDAPPEAIEPGVAELPRLPDLQHLSLSARVDGTTLKKLLGRTPSLRKLELHFPGWGPTLAGWEQLSAIEELVISNSMIADLRAVMATNKLERLRSLRIEGLGGSNPGDLGFVFASLNRLQRLSFRSSAIGDEGLQVLLESRAFPHLLALELYDAYITDGSVFQLAKTSHLPSLRWVRLGPYAHGRGLTEQSIYAVHNKFEIANPTAFE